MIRYTAVLSAILFAAVLSSIVLGLALPSTAACKQWLVPDAFWGAQSNGWAVRFILQQKRVDVGVYGSSLQGTAESALVYQRQYIKARGSADGSITGSSFQVTVYWNNQTIGVYQGGINPQGRIDGVTYDRWHPNSKAKWYSETLMACSRL